MTYPLPMRNRTIEADAEANGVPAYLNDEYPVAINEAQQRQFEARGWEPALVPVHDLSKLSHGDLTDAVEAAGIEVPKPRATKKELVDLLTKSNAEVVVDTTQDPPAVVANLTENKE